MKKLFLCFTMALVVSACSTSQKKNISYNHPFYEVSKDGQVVAYLLGTIHYGINYTSLSSTVKNIANDSDMVVLEADLISAQNYILKSLPSGENDSLKSQLTKDQWSTLSSTLAPLLGPNISLLNNMHPTMAAMTYSLSFLKNTNYPMDLVLEQNAKMNQKKIFYLESAESQVDLLLKVQSIDELRLILDMPKKDMAADVQSLLNAYTQNQVEKLAHIIEQELKPEFRNLVLEDRNLAWIKLLDEKVLNQDGLKFIAVGAGHLGGKTGLIEQLRKLQYEVIFKEQN